LQNRPRGNVFLGRASGGIDHRGHRGHGEILDKAMWALFLLGARSLEWRSSASVDLVNAGGVFCLGVWILKRKNIWRGVGRSGCCGIIPRRDRRTTFVANFRHGRRCERMCKARVGGVSGGRLFRKRAGSGFQRRCRQAEYRNSGRVFHFASARAFCAT